MSDLESMAELARWWDAADSQVFALLKPKRKVKFPKKAAVEKLARELYEIGRAKANEDRKNASVLSWDDTYEHQREAQRAVAEYVLANFERKAVTDATDS